MERKALQTATDTGHEGDCCAWGEAVLNRLPQIFGVVSRHTLLRRASSMILVLVMSVEVVLFETGLGVAQLADSPWPMRGHDARHTGRSPYKGIQVAHLKWKFRAGSGISSSPAIDSDGAIYVGEYYSHQLFAVNPCGTFKWKFQMGSWVESSPAIGSDGTIYVGCDDGYLYAVHPDGTLKWKFQTEDDIRSSPAIGSDGTIYVGSWDNHLYAINPDGTLKWKLITECRVTSSPAIGSDGTIYVGSGAQSCGVFYWHLYAVHPDGTVKWTFTTLGGFSTSPAIGVDGTVYAGSNDGSFYAINPDGTLKWTFQTELGYFSGFSSPATGLDGTVYVGSGDAHLYAINPDGTEKWKFKAGDGISSSPAIGSDGTIYVGSSDYHLYAVNPDGTEKWKYETGSWVRSSPAIGSDGTIYVGSFDGYLYAVGRSSGPRIMLSETSLNFGSVQAGLSKHLTFTIFNVGNAPVSVTSITSSSPEFVASPRSFDIAVDSRREVTVTFTPLSGGNKLATLTIASNDIASNDPFRPNATVTLSGRSGPRIVLSDTSVNFGPVQVGSSKELTLTFFNTGDTPLSVTSIISSSLEFATSPRSFVVAVDSSREVTVTFTPLSAVSVWDSLTITSNDPERSTVSVSLTANFRLADSPWPMKGHDARHTGQSPYKGIDKAQLKWKYRTGYWVLSSPAIGVDGTIYMGSRDCRLYAVHPDGTVKWGLRMEGEVVSSPAIGSDGTIYVGSDRYLYAVNPGGTMKWKCQTGYWATSSPAIDVDGTIYMDSGTSLYAVHPDGTVKWKSEMESCDCARSSSPAIGVDGTVYAGSWVFLYAVHPDGTVNWKTELEGAVASPAVGMDGTIYVGSGTSLYAIHPDGTVKWKLQMESEVRSCPAIGSDGTVYAGSLDNYLYAINPDGTLKWKYKTERGILSSPVIDLDGTVYVGLGTSVYALHPDGTLNWKFKMGESTTFLNSSSPAIGSDGTIYVGSTDEYLYAFGTTEGTAVEEPLDHSAIPQIFALQQNAPNPFNASTTIRYQLPQAGHVQLSIYNILGQKVRTLVDGVRPAGVYAVTWDGRDQSGVDVASGIYLYRLTGGNRSFTKKMLLLR